MGTVFVRAQLLLLASFTKPMSSKQKKGINLAIAFYMQVALVIALGVYCISAVNHMVRQFDELFGKKLIPAMDISHVLELQFQNRFHLEEFLTGLSLHNQVELLDDIHRNNAEIDSLVNLYITSSSYMEPEEKNDLIEFARAHKIYRKEENYIINLYGTGHGSVASARFKLESNIKFQNAVKPMKKFEAAELKLGKRILERVREQSNIINWILYASMAFALVIAIIVGLRLSRQYVDP